MRRVNQTSVLALPRKQMGRESGWGASPRLSAIEYCTTIEWVDKILSMDTDFQRSIVILLENLNRDAVRDNPEVARAERFMISWLASAQRRNERRAERREESIASLPSKVVIPSPDEIEAASTAGQGWTKTTLASWGVSYPPPKGWKADLHKKYRNQQLLRQRLKDARGNEDK